MKKIIKDESKPINNIFVAILNIEIINKCAWLTCFC